MTQIHGNAPSRDRLDDSTALQKRLLQDLERQWLDTWGQAQQLQTAQVDLQKHASKGAADSSGPTQSIIPAAVPTPLSGAGTGSAGGSAPVRAYADARQDDRDPDPAFSRHEEQGSVLRHSNREEAVSSKPVDAARLDDFSSAAQPSATGVTEPVGVAAATFASASTQKEPSQADAVDGTDSSAAGTEAALASSPSPAAYWTSTNLQSSASPSEGDSTPTLPQDVIAGAGAGAISMRDESVKLAPSGTALEAPTALAIAKPATPVPPQFAALGSATPAAQHAVPEGEAEPPAPARRLSSAAHSATEPGAQHLMLRELNDQEVLASMRDAQLSAHESQMAAKELARALMQAGYARVQVVVNGHERRQADVLAEDGTTDNLEVLTEGLPLATSKQLNRHGN